MSNTKTPPVNDESANDELNHFKYEWSTVASEKIKRVIIR